MGLIVGVGLLGIAAGSFLNLLADRLPRGEDVIWKRSHCDYCRKPLRWYELVPVLSFVVQNGRCRRCHKRLSLGYPIMELVTGVLFAATAGTAPSSFLGIGIHLAIVSALLVIFVADIQSQIIPDSMIVVVGVGTALQWMVGGGAVNATGYLLAGLGAGGFFWVLWLVTRGRGIGFGDVKLAVVLGLLLGFPQILFALYIAFLTGPVERVILIVVKKKSLKSRIAFGPFLILGALATWLFKSSLLTVWHRYL